MTFTVEHREDEDLPFAVLQDGKEFLTGFETEKQAADIAELLNSVRVNPKLIPIGAAKQALRQRGSVLIEFALVLPVLLLLILGGFDLILAGNAKNNLDYVAEQTAKCMMHNPSNCPDPQSYASQLAAGIGPVSPFFPVLNLSATAVSQ